MSERKKIEERLRRKEQEVLELEEQIKAGRVYVQALQDVLKMLPKAPDPTISADAVLRAGSAVARAREIILDRNVPVHISDLLQALGKEANRETRASLTSSLAAYVRRGEIFTRPAPNTFGLIELGHHTTEDTFDEPPPGFGEIRAAESLPPPALAGATSPQRQATSPKTPIIPATKAPPSEEDDDIPF